MTKKGNILDEAKRLVMGAREDLYGTPKENWQDTADMMTAFLHSTGKLSRDIQLVPEEAALMMICVKLARLGRKPVVGDNLVDVGGYALVVQRILTE